MWSATEFLVGNPNSVDRFDNATQSFNTKLKEAPSTLETDQASLSKGFNDYIVNFWEKGTSDLFDWWNANMVDTDFDDLGESFDADFRPSQYEGEFNTVDLETPIKIPVARSGTRVETYEAAPVIDAGTCDAPTA